MAELLNRIKIEHWSRAHIATLTFSQLAQCVLLFLVLAGNSTLLRFLCSYMLLLQSSVLMRSCIDLK